MNLSVVIFHSFVFVYFLEERNGDKQEEVFIVMFCFSLINFSKCHTVLSGYYCEKEDV